MHLLCISKDQSLSKDQVLNLHTYGLNVDFQYAGQVVIISVIEAKASRARGHSGHEAPPMTHSLVLTPPL